jgi:hypothetical protein
MKSDSLAESYPQSIATEEHVIKHDMKGRKLHLIGPISSGRATELDRRCVILLPVHIQYLVRAPLGKPLEI